MESNDSHPRFRRSSDKFIYGFFSKFCYFMFFILVLLVGGFFYLQYEVTIIKSTQEEGIKLFKMYSERDREQQKIIIDLSHKIEKLDDQLDENNLIITKKLDEFMKIILRHHNER